MAGRRRRRCMPLLLGTADRGEPPLGCAPCVRRWCPVSVMRRPRTYTDSLTHPRHGEPIHVMIPESRKEVSPTGVRVHRSRLIAQKRDLCEGFRSRQRPTQYLDLVGRTRSPKPSWAGLRAPADQERPRVQEILTAMGRRKRQRHRDLIKTICGTCATGVAQRPRAART